MVGKVIAGAGAIGLLAVFLVCGVEGQHIQHPLKLRVRFLATSTSIHRGDGRNQDVYLVELQPSSSDTQEANIARLVDEYPSFRGAIDRSILVAEPGRILRLVRDASCDRSISQTPLRTVPGDPSAVLPELLGFHPDIPSALRPETPLPCYRLVKP
jgi:hypothetical protein